MGKYTRNPKTSGHIDVSSSSYLGVRTRAKTLALQRIHSSSSSSLPKPDYLELRSRRLEKPPLLLQYLQNSRRSDNLRIETAPASGLLIGDGNDADSQGGGFEIGDLEIQVSQGENVLDVEESRGTRESTPCSLIRTVDAIMTPGSSTKQKSSVSNQRPQNVLRTIPSARELEEFFTQAEQPHQNYFIEKYNYDIVNDLPLPGRYEWIRVLP